MYRPTCIIIEKSDYFLNEATWRYCMCNLPNWSTSPPHVLYDRPNWSTSPLTFDLVRLDSFLPVLLLGCPTFLYVQERNFLDLKIVFNWEKLWYKNASNIKNILYCWFYVTKIYNKVRNTYSYVSFHSICYENRKWTIKCPIMNSYSPK